MRIAYQIPESDGEYQASSFEDAFIALNKGFILKNKEGFYPVSYTHLDVYKRQG